MMAKPYALSLYSPYLAGVAGQFEQSLTTEAKGWKRSIRDMGGCWQGTFSIEGKDYDLHNKFRRWLGYDVQERAGGTMSWRGLVYEMDLTLNGVTRRRSLDMMANRVRTTYTHMDWVGENMVGNPSFEDYDGGPPIDFFGWYEDPVNAAGVAVGHGGGIALLLTGTGVQYSKYVRQNVNVTPGASYQLTFWTRGDGGVSGGMNTGEVGIRDPNTQQWILGPQPTMNVSTTWMQSTVWFDGPSDGEVMVFFYCPVTAGRNAYFDDVEILEKQEAVAQSNWALLDGTGTINLNVLPTTGPAVTYGVKEEVIHLDGYPIETSGAYRNTYARENSYPWARPVSAGKPGVNKLTVTVCGYIWTMNWLYVMHGDGFEHPIDEWIRKIVGLHTGLSYVHGGEVNWDAGDCQWIRQGVIRDNDYLATNALQAPQLTGVEERPWDVIQELIELGDEDGNPWRGWVDVQQLFNYMPIDTTPRYYIRPSGIYDTMAGNIPSNPWTMQPGVFRDMTYRPPATEPGSFLQSVQDMYVNEVEMAVGWDTPKLKTTTFSEAEVLLEQSERGTVDYG